MLEVDGVATSTEDAAEVVGLGFAEVAGMDDVGTSTEEVEELVELVSAVMVEVVDNAATSTEEVDDNVVLAPSATLAEVKAMDDVEATGTTLDVEAATWAALLS